jgi:glycosyltransferase involved in cell wall biosynthesis
MYVGRPLPHKNLNRLIDAFKLLQQRFPDLHLILVGKKDPLYLTIEERLRKEGITNVFLTGFVTEGQLKWLYQNCRAYTFPSLSEGFGLPALEALRHGAPLVSSNATCSPEIYGDAALYFDPLNVQDMSDKIATMISDDQLRDDYKARGFAQADKYSWRRMAEQTLAVYKKALDE